MAIEMTTFNYPTAPYNNLSEVHDWLVANASEFFPGGIVKNDSRVYIEVFPIEGDNVTRVIIPFATTGNTSAGGIKTKYSIDKTIVNPNSTAYQSSSYKKAVKTGHGIAILANSGATMYIGRADNGNVCVIMEGTPIYNSNDQWRYVIGDLENSSYCVDGPAGSTLTAMYEASRLIANGQATVLVPMVFPGGSYSTSLFMTPFTQANFAADLQTVLIDGQEYVYDGLFALKG